MVAGFQKIIGIWKLTDIPNIVEPQSYISVPAYFSKLDRPWFIIY